jgi:hypothetical protein
MQAVNTQRDFLYLIADVLARRGDFVRDFFARRDVLHTFAHFRYARDEPFLTCDTHAKE